LVNAGFMAWARLIGVAVNVWTVNEVAEAQRLAALGVDTIITDVPDVLLAALREPGERNA
jgi:glycerophosphoryl diester phosphodiesterase